MWPFAFIPVAVSLAGAIVTAWRPPGRATMGGIQHFAAGVIFYAAAGELLPDALRGGAIWTIVLGGGLRIAAMLTLRRLAEGGEGPRGLIAAAALDALVDGLVLGLGFNAGHQQGELLALALAVEFLFLGLSISGAFGPARRPLMVVATTAAVALAVPVGAAVAQPLTRLAPDWQAAAFAFGLIALLYLVTEELLTEAHEKPETAWGTASFFIGFLAMMVLNMLIAG